MLWPSRVELSLSVSLLKKTCLFFIHSLILLAPIILSDRNNEKSPSHELWLKQKCLNQHRPFNSPIVHQHIFRHPPHSLPGRESLAACYCVCEPRSLLSCSSSSLVEWLRRNPSSFVSRLYHASNNATNWHRQKPFANHLITAKAKFLHDTGGGGGGWVSMDPILERRRE